MGNGRVALILDVPALLRAVIRSQGNGSAASLVANRSGNDGPTNMISAQYH